MGRYIALPGLLIDKGWWWQRLARWIRRESWKRENRYCHHEQPCWCGKPRDPKFKYEWGF